MVPLLCLDSQNRFGSQGREDTRISNSSSDTQTLLYINLSTCFNLVYPTKRFFNVFELIKICKYEVLTDKFW